MAKCKYCGKELPATGVCSCIKSMAAIGPSNKQFSAEGKSPLTRLKKTVFDHKKLIIICTASLILIITAIILIYNNTGARGAARKYAKNIYSKKGGRTYYSMTLPDKLYDSINDDKFDDMVDEFNDENKKTEEDYKVKLKKVKKTQKLSSKQLSGAEKAFAKNAAKYDKSYSKESYSAKKGYIYELTYKIKDRETQKTKSYTKELAVVKFSGEGWKIIDPDIDPDKALDDYLLKLGSKKK